MERVREMFLAVGVILLVAGLMLFLAFNPAYVSSLKHLYGYETTTFTEQDFENFIMVTSIIMPLTTSFMSIGATLILLGVFTREKK